jgi:hypothetical protein
LAKLPEENTDAWKQLEKAMNQNSLQKEDKEFQNPLGESMPI